MNRKLVSAVVTIALLSPLSAFAGTMGGGATLPEQMTQEITLAAQLSKEAETVRLEIQKVYDAAQNLQQVPNQLWQQGVQYLKQLVQLNGQAQSLGLAGQNLSSQFEQEYPSYSTQAQATQQQYEQWANAFNNEVAGSLQADHLSLSQFQSEQQALQTIESEPVSGRLQALEVGNQIAATTATEIGQLGAIVAKQQKSQAAYEEQVSQTKVDNLKAEEKFNQIQQNAAQSVLNNPNG